MSKVTERQKVGKIGEDIATRFLVKRGFSIITRNYLKTYGELDIICRKDNMVHFVEVKTVSRENLSSEGTDEYRPEDNIHDAKIRRIGRTIEAYLLENNDDHDWQFDVITVNLCESTKVARVMIIADIIL